MTTNWTKLITVMLICFLAYSFYMFSSRHGEIAKIYQNIDYRANSAKICKSTVILVDNAPIMHNSQESVWFRNKNKIINEWQPLTKKCDDIVFVKNTPELARHEAELEFWIGENQVCLKGELGGNQCIAKDDILYFISLGRTSPDDKVIDTINNKPIYIYFPSWT
ncbi:MAG: hypothetical protein E6X49_05745 [Leclercia adecarboxylata]|nr:hypothetical protein [uncultured Leclercia sp.]MDU4840638.1 hypothetical protein [Leclercia adecarboxylata]